MIIQLTKGYETIVDDNLFEWLNKFSWYAQACYDHYRPARRLTIEPRKMIYIYHQILGVEPWNMQDMEVDHINRNPLDNRLENLRLVTHKKNMQNTPRGKGVSFDATHRKWKAYYYNLELGKRMNIGTFATEEEAIESRRPFI